MDIDKLAVIGFFGFFIFMYLFHGKRMAEINQTARDDMEKNVKLFGKFAAPVAKGGFSILGWFLKRR